MKLWDLIRVRLSVRFFFVGTRWWMDGGMERKENERGFREDTKLTSSWTELEHHTIIIQDSRQ
jgi:chloramphenicol 3-O-phosphotransferase